MHRNSAINIGYKFLDLAQREGSQVTPMQLQKLVYIAHGWSLGLFRAPLISNTIYAWKFGPVIEDLYHHFKHFRSGAITESAEMIAAYNNETNLAPNQQDTINNVWAVYKGVSGLKLSDLTHQKGTPWDEVWNNQGGKDQHGAIINDVVIGDYYREFLTA